ncbi:MAG: type II 3-dehydroquinate dehydratase [Chloroflexota bacterium]|nr:type II 3-dehydroquinate dehydratase [Chloroflexota bacterium]
MPTVLFINGPNLNMLGKRDPSHYGSRTLPQIEADIKERGKALGLEVACFQSNHEGAIIDFLQAQAPNAKGVIINPGALTHYGLSLREALAEVRLPIIEVHLSNIHAREEWRRRSVTAPVVTGQMCGLGWRGYLAALDVLATLIKEGQ